MKLKLSGLFGVALAASCLAGNANAASYDLSDFSAEGQSYENVVLGPMTLSSEAGNLHYTNSYGGGIFAGYGADSDVYLTFAAPFSGSIAIRAGDGAGDSDAFGILAYAFGSNTLVGSWYSPVFGGPSEPEWYTLTTGSLANIGRIVFDPCNGGVCPGKLGSILGVTITDITITPVPEPETYAMLLAGLGLLGGIARRRKL